MVLVVLSIFMLSTFKNIRGDDNEQVKPLLPTCEKPEHTIYLQDVRDLSSCKKCGLMNRENSSDSSKGGQVQPPFKYSWMAAVQLGRKKICAGAILSEQYILTAAHCLINNSTEDRNGNKVDEENPKMEFWRPENITVGFLTHRSFVHRSPEIKKIIQHSGFNLFDEDGAKHNICLLELKEKIRCNKYMNPICLPPASAVISGGELFDVSGWDIQESEPADPTKPLKESEIKKVEFKECESVYPPDLKDHYYCLVKTQQEDACHIDGGSPMSFRRNGKHYVLGVASMFASDRCRNEEPFLFASVPDHIDWIEENTGLSSAKCEDFGETSEKMKKKVV